MSMNDSTNVRLVPNHPSTAPGSLREPQARTAEEQQGSPAHAASPIEEMPYDEELAGTSELGLVPTGSLWPAEEAPVVMVPKPIPRVLLIHTGGTLGMDAEKSFETDPSGHMQVKPGTGGNYVTGLSPGKMLANIKSVVPELGYFADLDLQVAFNRDSCRVGPKEWVKLAQMLHVNRDNYDAFMIVHGTDTMAYTASALSLMLHGFRKPIVVRRQHSSGY